jgi:hypothetical protein
VQALLKSRARVGRGRRGKHVNLFAGLLKDARTGGSLTAKHLANRSPALIPVDSKQGKNTAWTSYPLRPFEKAILSELIEVKLADIKPGNGGASKVDDLATQQEALEALIKKWQAKMNRPEIVDMVADKLAELRNKQQEVAEQLALAQREAANPFSEALGQFRTAGRALATDNSDEMRERCRTAIRRVVESVWVLILPGRPGWGVRLCAVQVWFKSGAHRDYLIGCTPPRSNGKRRIEERVFVPRVGSLLFAAGRDLGLREPAKAQALEQMLTATDLAELVKELRPIEGNHE